MNSVVKVKAMKTFYQVILLSLFSSMAHGQLMTFDFAALAGNEVSAASNANDPNISTGTITRGAGLTASANGGRFNATNWSTVSIPNAVSNNQYMEITITPDPGCDFSISSIVVQLQRSATGPSSIALRSSADGFTANLDAIYPIVDNTTTQSFTFTFTHTAVAVARTYRFYMFAESAAGSGGLGDGTGNDITVNGSTNCGAPINTITTTTLATPPFSVDCATPTTALGSVAFTSTGTFTGGNTYTAQLSDATGSFASPQVIGSISSTALSGSIPITIPATQPGGTGYVIRIISSSPGTIGTSTSAFTIVQTGTCGPALPASQGLIINEWSNGPSGNQEFYEFVVAGVCGTSVDIRGYILDDNNGTFTNPADYSGTASGIAPGHFRFTYDPQWAAIPVGSLIVVYNAEDPNPAVPADDPSDANTDSLYVVPHNSTLFERCTILPATTSPDSIYTGCTYATAPFSGWSPLSLRNSGDAIQVREPDGTYFHGVSYGGTEMSGGPNNLKLFTGSGAAMCGWFTDNDFFDIANWSSGAVGANETPGLPNNALNLAWLRLMRDPNGATCPIVVLPVEMVSFEGRGSDLGNQLWWATASETNSSYFLIERSTDGKLWQSIGTVVAVGNSQTTQNYNFTDVDYSEVVNYYRLIQWDKDGSQNRYAEIVAIDNQLNKGTVIVARYNLLGQEVDAHYKGVHVILFDDGSTKKVTNF